MMKFDQKFKYVLPRTGGLGWTDTLMIPKDAPNPAGAHMFIDFMLRPEIAAMLTDESGYTTTVEGALDKSTVENKEAYTFSEDELQKLIWQPNFSEDVILHILHSGKKYQQLNKLKISGRATRLFLILPVILLKSFMAGLYCKALGKRIQWYHKY